MNKTFKILSLLLTCVCLCSCSSTKIAKQENSQGNNQENKQGNKDAFIAENTQYAERQLKLMLEHLGEPTGKNYPRTFENNKVKTTNIKDWTPGFFPGALWYLYELTGDAAWASSAEKWTLPLEPSKYLTSHHDVGFIMYCSFGNAQRLKPQPQYNDIIEQSAKSLSTRYNETAKVIKSWNYRKSWNDTTEMFYPVIIDNMMNLEMMMYAARTSGNKKYEQIAINHANTTMKNHFRRDYSSYHVVDYDTITANVKTQATNQGYSDNSTWSRGQAWAIYGYTMMYRETKDVAYLEMAKNVTAYYLQNLPEDLIPVWDFNVGQEGYTPGKKSKALGFTQKFRDCSAGAVACSALFELGTLSGDNSYIDAATKMLQSLASDSYRAKVGENGNFILMHCVGSVPGNFEVDTPLIYADYYFLEALTRYKKLKK